ncbi:MAG: proline dehydrogenase family protein [Deltaproteobacteria bacterium]|nr:proline dehydrogenase family protein [Deltaproteobacteria bacterium]
MAQVKTLEERTVELGLEIYDSIKGEVPGFFDSTRWKGKIMDWAMKDEQFKVQLFRFVDTIPAIKEDRDLLPLIHEYFLDDKMFLSPALKKLVPKKGMTASLAGKLVKSNVQVLARQFIAAHTPQEAMKKITSLRKEGRTATVDLLGEAVLSDQEAYLYTERYIEIIKSVAKEAEKWPDSELLDNNHMGSLPKVDLSLKISSFYSRLDPIANLDSITEVTKTLGLVFEEASERNLSLTLDMEHYQLKDLTIEVFKALLTRFPDYNNAGIAIQTYLKDSEKDLASLIEWARKKERIINVRLVKGAYWDYEKVINSQAGWPIPVYTSKTETDANFEKLTLLLLENSDVVRPAIASHNIRSMAHAMAIAESLGLPKKGVEFQALFGMAEPIKKAVASRGYRVREYLPVGEFLPGMAYLVRRLLENTSNESFLKLSFADKIDAADLISRAQSSGTEGKEEEKRVKAEGFSNIPNTDFSKSEMRKLFGSTLKKVRAGLGGEKQIPLIMGGKKITTDKEIISVNPANPEEIVGRVAWATGKDTLEAIQCAGRAFLSWRNELPQKRAACLEKAARWMTEKRYEIAALQVFEVGKSWREADADLSEAIDFLNFYAQEMIELSEIEKLGNYPGERNHQHYIPRGVAAIISPWNFPLAIVCGMTAAAIVTGNCAIVKPSSLSPVTAYYLIQAFQSAGLPDGVIQFLPGPGSATGAALADHPDVDIIAFTGSMEVGLALVERAGKPVKGEKNVKKVIAEMGGKNAIIIDKSADLDEAIKGVVASFTGFQGQKCSACSRVIVVGAIVEDFIARLTEAVRSITIGPPDNPANIMGPMIDEAAMLKVREYVEIGKKEATLHYRSEHVPTDGFYAGPVIFRDVKADARIATEEIFGPILAVISASTIDEAIKIANDTPYALTGGIYSRSPANIEKARKEFLVGNFYINRKITGALVSRQPFGGFKMSGLGSKAGGEDYLRHFLFPRVISENTLRRGFAPEE